MKKNRSLVAAIFILSIVFSVCAVPLANAAGGVGNASSASFTYAKGYSSYTDITSLKSTSNSEVTGIVKAYDDGTYLYLWVYTWAKPYLG